MNKKGLTTIGTIFLVLLLGITAYAILDRFLDVNNFVSDFFKGTKSDIKIATCSSNAFEPITGGSRDNPKDIDGDTLADLECDVCIGFTDECSSENSECNDKFSMRDIDGDVIAPGCDADPGTKDKTLNCRYQLLHGRSKTFLPKCCTDELQKAIPYSKGQTNFIKPNFKLSGYACVDKERYGGKKKGAYPTLTGTLDERKFDKS